MYNPIIADKLKVIIYSIELIEKRMNAIHSAKDLVKDEKGIMILDSIAKRLEHIGNA